MKCMKCGKETGDERQICSICSMKWTMGRLEIYRKADEVIGKLCPENKEAWMDKVEELKKEEKRA